MKVLSDGKQVNDLRILKIAEWPAGQVILEHVSSCKSHVNSGDKMSPDNKEGGDTTQRIL